MYISQEMHSARDKDSLGNKGVFLELKQNSVIIRATKKRRVVL